MKQQFMHERHVSKTGKGSTTFRQSQPERDHFFCDKEEIGEALDFAPRKILTEANNHGRIVVVSPNAETASGWFSGNPSSSVMTPSLRSPAVPAEPKTARHSKRVFRRAMLAQPFLRTSHTTDPSLQHAPNCTMPLCMSSSRAIRVQCFRSSFSSSVVTNRVSRCPSP
jgi:hypothetical protein